MVYIFVLYNYIYIYLFILYIGYSAAQIISKVAHENLRPRIPSHNICANLMSECWSSNPSERPGFHRILKLLSKMYTNQKTKIKIDNSGSGGTGNNIIIYYYIYITMYAYLS